MIQKLFSYFREQYGCAPEFIVRAPGRVNIIGEHTDYNHGFVLPMAIERQTFIAVAPRNDQKLCACAANLQRTATLDLDDISRNPEEPWIDYIAGVAQELKKSGYPVRGADIVIMGDVPIGSGLSSSASLEMAALVMFENLGHFRVEGSEAPQLGQRVENLFLGVNSGIMDQFIIRMGKEGHALFLDCRTHAYDLVPVAFSDARFVIANTGVSRGLSGSKYNERVDECQAAVKILSERTGHEGTHLRDFSLEELEQCTSCLDEVHLRRARHVISENDRTIRACNAMRKGDVTTLGKLMNASHDSLRDDYEVTCHELDIMVDIARSLDGCYGARMTGAGFGGCTVHLVEKEKCDTFTEQLLDKYHHATGIKGDVIISAPAQGADLVSC